jgi:hypothetical protein
MRLHQRCLHGNVTEGRRRDRWRVHPLARRRRGSRPPRPADRERAALVDEVLVPGEPLANVCWESLADLRLRADRSRDGHVALCQRDPDRKTEAEDRPEQTQETPTRNTKMKVPHPERQPQPPGPRVHRRLSSDMVRTMSRTRSRPWTSACVASEHQPGAVLTRVVSRDWPILPVRFRCPGPAWQSAPVPCTRRSARRSRRWR